MNVKAIRLSDKTDPDLLEFVESFESSMQNWKFREEEGSEGEEFDGEGWNLKFWGHHRERGQKRKEERMGERITETIGGVGMLTENKTLERGKSPERWPESSNRSRARSPRQREQSYSTSPPPKRRQSRSQSPRKKWSTSPRPVQQQKVPSGPSSIASPMQPQHDQYPQQGYSQIYQQAPYTANPGYYWDDFVRLDNSIGWNQREQYPPPPTQPPSFPEATISLSSQSYGRYQPPPNGGGRQARQ